MIRIGYYNSPTVFITYGLGYYLDKKYGSFFLDWTIKEIKELLDIGVVSTFKFDDEKRYSYCLTEELDDIKKFNKWLNKYIKNKKTELPKFKVLKIEEVNK